MSNGVIGGISEVVEWEIPDFFSLDQVEPIHSPSFSLVGCMWELELYPKGFGSINKGFVSVFLYMNQLGSLTKEVSFSIGIKTEDGIEKENEDNYNFIHNMAWGCGKFWNRYELQQRKSELAPSDTLTITCRIKREMPILEDVLEPEMADSKQRMLVELETLSSDLKDLLVSERKCDVTINVQGKDFRAHKAMLSARSPVFRAMYEHDTSEDESGVLRIPDCDPDSFSEFLNFLYTGRTEDLSFQRAYHLFATADKYDVQQLKSFCANCVIQNLTAENVCEVVIMADRYSNDELMSSAEAFFNENFCVILLTSEWTELLKNYPRLADKLLKKMASVIAKNKNYLNIGASSSRHP